MFEKPVELYIPQKEDDLDVLIKKMELLNQRLKAATEANETSKKSE